IILQREVSLRGVGYGLAVFAQNAINVIAPLSNDKVKLDRVIVTIIADINFEAVAAWSPVRSDQIRRQRPQVMKQNRSLLVPVCIQQHSSLLHQHAGIMFVLIESIESVACEIASVFALHALLLESVLRAVASVSLEAAPIPPTARVLTNLRK